MKFYFLGKKFGGLKNNAYLCSRLSVETQRILGFRHQGCWNSIFFRVTRKRQFV